MKNCNKCGIQKPLSDFGKHNKTKDKLNRVCKKCAVQQSIDSYKKNPDTKRNYNLKRAYGITLQDFENMKTAQNNKCAICQNIFKNSVDSCVDHCHTTKKVRGILCNHCNRAIGLFKESPISLKSALKYLKKYS
jgi:hypothetical protein